MEAQHFYLEGWSITSDDDGVKRACTWSAPFAGDVAFWFGAQELGNGADGPDSHSLCGEEPEGKTVNSVIVQRDMKSAVD